MPTTSSAQGHRNVVAVNNWNENEETKLKVPSSRFLQKPPEILMERFEPLIMHR